MAEYIDREALIDAIEEINWYKYNDEGRLTQGGTSHDKMFLPYSAVEGTVKNFPAADVREVVRGKWTKEHLASTSGGTYTVVRCSVCGASHPFFEGPAYCPNCGADMRETRWTQIVCNKCGGKRFIARGDFVVCDKCGARMEES